MLVKSLGVSEGISVGLIIGKRMGKELIKLDSLLLRKNEGTFYGKKFGFAFGFIEGASLGCGEEKKLGIIDGTFEGKLDETKLGRVHSILLGNALRSVYAIELGIQYSWYHGIDDGCCDKFLYGNTLGFGVSLFLGKMLGDF